MHLVTCSPLVPSCTAWTIAQSPDKLPDKSLDHSAVNYHMPLLCSPQHHYLTYYGLPAHDVLSFRLPAHDGAILRLPTHDEPYYM